MNAFSRSKKHISMDRVKEMHEEKYQRQLLAEKKEAKRQKRIKEEASAEQCSWRQELVENKGKPEPTGFPIVPPQKKVKVARPVKEDWRGEYNSKRNKYFAEGMTTQALGMINLDAEPNTIQDAMPPTTISQADNIAPPKGGVTVRAQSFQAVDATRTDTLTFKISGTFGTKAPSLFDGAVVDDKIWIGVLVNGTYGGNYLAKELGNGVHQIAIPPRFRKPGVRFDAIQIYAFEGEGGYQSTPVNISAIGTKRVNPMTLFVGLDDPEANSFVRSGLDNLSAAERRKRLQQIMKGSRDYMKQQLDMDWSADIADTGVVTPWDQANPGGIEVAQAEYPEDEWNQEDEMLLKWLQQGGLPGAETEKDIERLLQRKSKYGGGFSRKTQDLQVAHYEPEGKLIEMMTTAGLMQQELSAQGDRNLETVSNSVSSKGSNPGAGGGNGNYNFGPVDDVSLGSSVTLNGPINTERYDTLKFNFGAGTIDTFYAVTSSGSTYRFSATSGPKVLKFNTKDRNNKSIEMAFYVQNGGSEDKPIGNTYIRNLSYQRRSNIVLNLSLGDQDGGSFIRGGIGGSKQRRQNLKDMLDGGNEWMAKNGLSPSKTSPGDIKLAGYGLRPDGTQGLNMPGDIVPDHNGNPMKLVPDPSRGRGFNKWVPVKKAGGGGTMVAHYEPQGKVISEKKKLKSVNAALKKNVGFPETPPPKMINGFHPDLVTGDRAAKRFNKLDPTSAKAMPKTAYPHIDKKVQAAAKKPK